MCCLIYYDGLIVSNRTTVIKVAQSYCSIRIFQRPGLKLIQKGVSEETLKPPWIRHWYGRVPNEKIDIHQIISLPIQSIYLSTPMLEPP